MRRSCARAGSSGSHASGPLGRRYLRPRRPPHARALVVLALASVPALPLADTLLVGPPGSGAPFDSIPAAVAAAQPGDTVCVLPGSYTGTETLEIDKPLTLLGSGMGVTTYTLTAPAGVATPALRVHDLAPGKEVRVAGLRLTAMAGAVTGPTVFLVADCAGPVVLADVWAVGKIYSFPGEGAGLVRASSQVLLDTCIVTSTISSAPISLPGPQPALVVEGSSVHLNACTITGSDGLEPKAPPGQPGTPGVIVIGSTLRVSRCVIRGGDAHSGLFTTGPPFDGAPAILALGSTLFVSGGPGNSSTGGAGSKGELGGFPAFGLGAPAVALSGTSSLTAASDVSFTPGAESDGTITMPPVFGGPPWSPLQERLATLTIVPSITHPGSPVTVETAGEPGGVFLSFFSLGQDAALAVPGVHGVIVLDLAAYAALPPVALDLAGLGALPVPMPPSPLLAGTTVLVQALSQSPAGTLSISSPAFVGIAP